MKDEEESVKLWLDEHAKKKIRGLVETFVEDTRRLGRKCVAMVLHVKNDARIVYSS